MNKKYYKIIEKSQKVAKSETIFQKYIKKMLFCIFPVQNPNFEEIFDNVDYWFVEFDENLSHSGNVIQYRKKVICKMPF